MSFNKNGSRTDQILVVDDIPDNLFLIKTILEDEGYEITLVENGMDALKAVQQSPPDLVLLDVMMPDLDGYEVTRRIRNNAQLPYIPILLISAHDNSSVVIGLDAGADDFIRKPVDADELLARVRSLLRLKHSIDEREHMSRQREDFVSRLTHDLRTPLVAADRIYTLFQQGAFGSVSPDMATTIDNLIRNNQNLLQMVNTLLEVYRYEAGRKNLVLAPCDLKALIEDVAQELTPLAQEKGLTLKINVDQCDPSKKDLGIVNGDRLELRRVITNLVANAIKFTDQGGVEIHLTEMENVLPAADGNGHRPAAWLTIDVMDTGAGITTEDQAVIFDRFRQGQHKRSGSGLGLHLSRRIVEAHGGKVGVTSSLGQGSVFTIQLPKLA
ncbi:response regulator [Pantanalinema rosaneae CENA516]|uniref:hybrid sensor histidine kinase/response regulator n=1 Tax=Pantanalinema rosaneae TaxID=1620701 RepID=UPI003D6F3613